MQEAFPSTHAGFQQVEYNSVDAVAAVVDDLTAASSSNLCRASAG